ncbi:heat shock 70 kDa protein 12A-like [Mya arenaria]|uniref:heat shock 70 kDa protein 12A-like n=1 Tax=Mya arenaria TaxID=6604 RepID=UPI0022E09B03|nr:heat shock 70 kDa protein 12A-like [Mya arenaria]
MLNGNMERSSSREGSTVSTETTWQDKLIVAAIDFGTTFSGFVLSFLDDYRQDKTSHILSHEWSSGEGSRTAKTPTAVLLKPDTSLDSFGYEAENRFLSENVDDDEDDEQSDRSDIVDPETWYFFRNFKMKLYGDKLRNPITFDSKIPDERGRELSAILVFSRAIAYMKMKIFEVVSERFPKLREDDIYYVMTCPAIWSETSKQFMSDAAEKAGIPYNHIRIALEPECAAVYMLTKEVPSLSSSLRERFPMNEGDCYIVADLGGGTLDIAAHRINENRKYDEIMTPDGGPYGGNNINHKFEQFLISISGAPAYVNFTEKHSQDYLYLMRSFEHKKYGFPGDASKASVTMRMPFSFVECHREENHESFQESVRQTSFSKSVILKRDTITVKKPQFESLFEETLVQIEDKLARVMEKLSKRYNIKAIFCVGGFSDCKLVKEKIKVKFSNRHLVIIPAEANVAIMKGAVIYGRDERIIETRISKYTFGLDWNEDFDPKVHPVSKREYTDDGYMCKDIFKVIAKVNDPIPTSKPTKIIESYVKTASQTAMEFPFYRTLTDPPPRFIDEPNCYFMGSMKVSLEDTTGGTDRFVTLKIFLGATTLRAEAIDNKGRTHRVKFLLDESQV